PPCSRALSTSPRTAATSSVTTSSARRPGRPSSRTTVSTAATSIRSAMVGAAPAPRLPPVTSRSGPSRRPELAEFSVHGTPAVTGHRQELLEALPQLGRRSPFVLEVDVGAEQDDVVGVVHHTGPEEGGGPVELPGLAESDGLLLAGEEVSAVEVSDLPPDLGRPGGVATVAGQLG